MTGAMLKKFRQEWLTLPVTGQRPPNQSIQDTVTLASLVERETSAPGRTSHVAGVFETAAHRPAAAMRIPRCLRADSGGTLHRQT